MRPQAFIDGEWYEVELLGTVTGTGELLVQDDDGVMTRVDRSEFRDEDEVYKIVVGDNAEKVDFGPPEE